MADPRSKIPQDSWGGVLDHGPWIRYIETQYGFNISIWPSLYPRFLQEELGSAILKFNAFQYLNGVLCPSWFCYLHGSSVMCMSAAPKKSRKPVASLPHEPAQIVFGFVWNRTALWQKQCFLVSFLRKVLHCPNKNQSFRRPGELAPKTGQDWFLATAQHVGKKVVSLGQYSTIARK